MKFSYNWIQELAPALRASPEELKKQITLRTAECEGIEPVGRHFGAVVAAKVVSVEPIEGAHNQKVVVKSAAYGTRTVVCGAPNVRPGMVTAYVPPGTAVQGKLIEKAVLAGVESDGMLASGAELGINRDHDGILDLPGGIGCTPDWVIEIDNKSITHRPDLWGHYGMAREVAAIFGIDLMDPVNLARLPKKELALVDVAIEDFALCPRYSALVFENVTVQASPLWLQYRLESIGLNPINNIVDVTNYLMAELAQPMHAFDADKVKGGIRVRVAREGESITALNDESYSLTPANLLITDEGGPIAVAGVIGGSQSAISGGTTRIILESACFKAASVRKTAQTLKCRTDASMRFEKSQDPVTTTRALARAIELLEKVSPGIRVAGGLADVHDELRQPPHIELPLEWLRRKLGVDLPTEQAKLILNRLQFKAVEIKPGILEVAVPTWRATKDVSLADDLVEEVGRMIGYDNITPVAPRTAAVPPPVNAPREFQHALRQVATQQGFTEVYNYSFVNEEMAAPFGFRAEEHVRVLNPIASDQGMLRKSLLPGIHRNLVENAKHAAAFKLFEIGFEIHKVPGQAPLEIPQLCAAVYHKQDGEAGLRELVRLAQCFHAGIYTKPGTALPYEHPGRVAEVWLAEAAIGRVFELHPRLLKGRGAVLDICLDLLKPETKAYQPVRKVPGSDFDLSIVAAERVPVRDVALLLTDELLESCEFLLRHPLGDGRQSVSFRLTVAAPDRTLTAGEITSARERVIARVRAAGFELR